MSIRRKMGIGFGALLGLTALLTSLVLYQLGEIQRQFSSVIEQDAPAIAQARQLLKLVVDMETGQRGFVITGNDEFLDPYRNAQADFSDLMHAEKELVRDSSEQIARLEKIEQLVHQWQTKAAAPEIAMRRRILKAKVGARQLQNTLAEGVGKRILDEIRVVTSDISHQFQSVGNMSGVLLIERFQRFMVDQETGERGFLITGEEEFLEPYQKGQVQLRKAIKELRTLVGNAHDREATAFDLAELTALHDRWIADIVTPEFSLRRQVETQSPPSQSPGFKPQTTYSKTILDEIRTVLDRLAHRFAHAENEKLHTLVTSAGKAVVDQATGHRGFLITGKDEFLQPYENGRKQWNKDMRSLQARNANAYDIEIMKANIDGIERLAEKWFLEAAHPEIAARRDMNAHPETLEDLAVMLENGTGKRLLDSIRKKFHLFVEEEEFSANQRFARASSAAESTSRATVAIMLLSLIFGGIVAVVIIRGITQPVDQLASALEMIAQGDLNQAIQVTSDDEFGSLSKSFNLMSETLRDIATVTEAVAVGDLSRKVAIKSDDDQLGKSVNQMIDNLKEVVNQANEISLGDYSTSITPRSHHDRLGVALFNMTTTLRETRDNLEADANLKNAQAKLADLLRDSIDVSQLCDGVSEFIAKFTNSQIVAFYLQGFGQDVGDKLSMVGNYGLPNGGKTYDSSTGAGLVVQAVRTNQSILISDVPEDYFQIASCLGRSVPRNALLIPLSDGNIVRGIIELGSFTAFADDTLADVERLLQPVGAAIASKQGAEEVQRLLTATQAQAEKLVVANEELVQKSNDLNSQKVVTEEKNTALELAKRQLERKARELELSSKFKSDFLANMSHEIRTPMTAILGFAEILQERVNDDEAKDWLDKIQRNGDHLLGIINDILDISKIESNNLAMESICVSPSRVIADVVSLLDNRASGKGLTLRLDSIGQIPDTIWTDPTRLRQILVNLIGNAIKFTEFGDVRIVARFVEEEAHQPRLAIDVIDTGIGMKDDQMDALFQPFAQADSSTTRKYGGTGLGLSISRRLAVMLGGELTYSSVFGEGSTFSVTVSTGSLEGVEMLDRPFGIATINDITSKPLPRNVELDCRVLLVEDGPDNQRLLSFILEKAGAEVVIAENGQIAIDHAMEANDAGDAFDVILMDMQMPVLDGYGATRELRKANYTGPIIALTAHAMKTDREKCLDAGCNDFMTKPINRAELIAVVSETAQQRALLESVPAAV